MAWYAAHIIQYARFLDGVQNKYPCRENVVLIEAGSATDARKAAEQIGHATYGANYGSPFTYENRPAEWTFGGIRKLIECDNMNVTMPDRRDPAFSPSHGTEITYSELEVEDEAALRSLADGAPVVISYIE